MAKRRRRPYRQFTPEEKHQAVQDYLQGVESMYAVSKRLGINYNNLQRWVKQADLDSFQSSSKEQPAPAPTAQTRVEAPSASVDKILLDEYRRENAALTEDLQMYCAAMAHFAMEYFMLLSSKSA